VKAYKDLLLSFCDAPVEKSTDMYQHRKSTRKYSGKTGYEDKGKVKNKKRGKKKCNKITWVPNVF
jgi:hypothetical protein